MGSPGRYKDLRAEIARNLGVYLVTDRRLAPGAGLLRPVEEALKSGVRAVQLREKDLDGRSLVTLARDMRSLSADYGARLFINDRVDVAMSVGADGVHLGQKSMPARDARGAAGEGLLIGVSAHGLKEALLAREDGADFITLGPVFHTPAKAGYAEPVGPAKLHTVCASVDIPVYAIGGIKDIHVGRMMEAGAAGVAVISAIIASDDARGSAAEFMRQLKAYKGRRSYHDPA
ncbi:MAG: thiamine phosphate synthase [Deltaproteobacteria bacterium]|nr:thiamine phosphate synthase [Deltaproteobacteria bacterium]